MDVFLVRQYYKTHTFGILVANYGVLFHTLERPWRDNIRNESCIPSGEYTVSFLPRSASGKYRKVWLLHSVPNRSGILIHQGNITDHSRGCLLLGMKRGELGGKPAVLASRLAMQKFRSLVETKPFQLHILGSEP